jgi:fructose-bisphosphate aldolase class II
MPLIPMQDLLDDALREAYAVGYFEAWDQYSLEAVLEAAEEAMSPVILGFGGVMMDQGWFDGGGLKRLAALGRAASEDSRVPVSFLLNEVETFDQVMLGIDLGFSAVMLDTSGLSLDDNIAAVRRVTDAAHARGVAVEGECGSLPDASGRMDDASTPSMTDPDEAARYVAESGVDALSVSIGNVHILTQGHSNVDFERLAKIHGRVSVPLVIHGGTGFPDEAVPRAIKLGVAKFNVGTILKQLYIEEVRRAASALPDGFDVQETVGSRKPSDIFEQAKDRVKDETKRRMSVYGSVGRA